MSYKDMTAVEYGEKVRKIMDGVGRTSEFCNGVDCDECMSKFGGQCVGYMARTDDFEKAVELVYNYKFDILDEKEKKYLSEVIKPFRDRIEYLRKNETEDDYYFIAVRFHNGDGIFFPNFKPQTMYKGMEVNKRYTLEELGL